MKTIVIHHSADFDGLFCREIARKFLPDAELIGWDYGDPVPVVPHTTPLYILDLSIDGLMDHPLLTWIDHHKSAIDKFPGTIPGYRIDGVAACRLAWQWFAGFQSHGGTVVDLPTKAEFIERTVNEPLAVRLAGEYDIWDKRDPDADTFQFALRASSLTEHVWNCLLDPTTEQILQVQQSQIMACALMPAGAAVQRYQKQLDESTAKNRSFDLEWEGKKFLAINATRCNSATFEAACRLDHDGLLGFYWNGKEWTVSLYHSPAHKEHDLSQIAVKYGGGGHRGACGFRASKLSFIP